MLQGGQILAARYVLLRRLGEGRATEVWQARDRDTGTDRVLKVLASDVPGARERLLAAGRLQLQLRHPNLQACVAVHEDDPPFLVLAGVARSDLSVLRGRPGPQLLPALCAVAEALAALHERGLVHRDLKPANVLLGDDGVPLLADFGMAAAAGDEHAPSGGSPFAMSPQQLDGRPADPADDLYAFGAMAYELLTGYPPFYPDARPERIRHESPAALPERLAVPPPLAQLVMDCLAKEQRDRPASAAAIAQELRALALRGTAVAGAGESRAVALQPPTPLEPAIDAQWSRTAVTAPSDAQLRSQGFRRGLVAASFGFLLLAAAFVFLVLPQQVERDAAAPPGAGPAPAAPAAAPSDEARDLQQLAEAKRAFEEQRPDVERQLAALESRSAAQWGGETFARAKRGVAEALAAYEQRDYAAARDVLQRAAADLAATGQLAAAQLEAALAAGAAALGSGTAFDAQRQFQRALAIEPGHAGAQRGLERAGTLDEVRRLLASGAALEQAGRSAEAAATYRKVLQLDRDATPAREALARLETQAASAAYAAAVSQGLNSLARQDYAGARAAFERAGRLRPGTPEVVEGLAQAERGLGGRTIAAHLAAAREAERTERWAQALAEYRKALAADGHLLEARQGLERAEPRAMLDAELAAYLERPERMFSPEVRAAARAALQRAQAIPAPGPVLARQVESVERLVVGAETPLRVALASDNVTDVTIHRVGRLGSFERKDVELLPGRYTVVGVRAGYRDVRREITLLPGREAPTVVIRCEEPI